MENNTLPINNVKHKMNWMKEHSILLFTIFGVIIGIVIGFCARPWHFSDTAIILISYPGELFMRLLKLLILPLILASLITGSSSLNAKLNGKIMLRTLGYFVITSAINALLGTLLGIAIKPGSQNLKSEHLDAHDGKSRGSIILDSFLDLGRNVITENIFQATFQQAYTNHVNSTVTMFNKVTGLIESREKVGWVIDYRNGTNTLGMVFFCIIFGTALGTLKEKSSVVIEFFNVVYEVIMKLVTSIIVLTPIGVASIIAGKILSAEDVMLLLSQLGWFNLTVIVGVFLYQLIIMPLIYLLIVKKNPFPFYFGLTEGTLTAFATASTAAALPITFRIMDTKLKVDPRITRFVLPIGCNINMDGTALYIAVASMFISQMHGVSLDVGQLVTVWIMSTSASFASVSIPSAGVVLVSMVLSAIDVPVVDIPLLFAIDWFVDRFRTTNNMLGDCYAAAIVEKLSLQELLPSAGLQSVNLLPSSAELTKNMTVTNNLIEIVIH